MDSRKYKPHTAMHMFVKKTNKNKTKHDKKKLDERTKEHGHDCICTLASLYTPAL